MDNRKRYILGLDLGVSSIGWAMIGLGKPKSPTPECVIEAGVRIFEAGVEGDIEQGRDSSRASVRRQARQVRRQNRRTQHRMEKLFKLLQQLHLLPPSNCDAKSRNQLFESLDAELTSAMLKQTSPSDELDRHLAHQRLAYWLRAEALSRPLQPYELGRAIYQLAQRRGYLSNRKTNSGDESDGIVAQSIEVIAEAAGDRTIGQFFAEVVDPFANTKDESGAADPTTGRFRRRYTSRRWFLHEFDSIRIYQADHHKLNDEDWKRLRNAIFWQRPLKSQKHLIGRCSLMPKFRRCPEALPIFQEFRILQAVNHLRILMPDQTERPLTPTERQKLINGLQSVGELSLKSSAKRVIGLPKNCSFTLEEWDKDAKLVGNRTNQKMLKAFGDLWWKFDDAKQESIIREVLHYRNPSALRSRAQKVWNLSADGATTLADIRLEEGHGSHCKQAIERLLPHLRNGMTYAEARKLEFPESHLSTEPKCELPPVVDWSSEIRNPAVIRALTETRKVVNAIIRRHGRPEFIRVELSRDLKNSRDRRKKIWENNRENEKRREKAKAAMLQEIGVGSPNRSAIERWQLFEECNGQCPYCGVQFNGADVIGQSGRVNIEHIYPRRYLDNSFTNKTLACRSCNDRKGDMLPGEAFSSDEMAEILERVKRFQGPQRNRKLERFMAEKVPEDFTSRDLNDTRYISRLASDYLGVLFGGRNDSNGTQRVITPTGGLTSLMRRGWGLNMVLNESNFKDRELDHRHHAIDAIVVALTSQGQIQALSNAASNHPSWNERDLAFLNDFPEPWKGFVSEVSNAIHSILVSHRPTRTMGGAMHAESIYSKPHSIGGKTEYRIRKELKNLTEAEITGDQIADPNVRMAILEKWHEIKKDNPKAKPSQVWSDPRTNIQNFPRLRKKDSHSDNQSGPLGDGSPIFKVRLKMSVKPRPIGRDERQRNVAGKKNTNFACMVYAELDNQGNEKRWIHEIIDRMTAYMRLAENPKGRAERILIPDEQNGKRRFLFAICKNDCLELNGPNDQRVIYRVVKLSAKEIQLSPLHVPRIRDDERTIWDRITSTNNLRMRLAFPVKISPDGVVEKKAWAGARVPEDGDSLRATANTKQQS